MTFPFHRSATWPSFFIKLFFSYPFQPSPVPLLAIICLILSLWYFLLILILSAIVISFFPLLFYFLPLSVFLCLFLIRINRPFHKVWWLPKPLTWRLQSVSRQTCGAYELHNALSLSHECAPLGDPCTPPCTPPSLDWVIIRYHSSHVSTNYFGLVLSISGSFQPLSLLLSFAFYASGLTLFKSCYGWMQRISETERALLTLHTLMMLRMLNY